MQKLVWIISLSLLVSLLVACGSEDDPSLDVVPSDEGEIVGGTAYRSLPAIGALFVDGAPHCTGTLVGPRKVLTAAHCVTQVTARRMTFRLGPNAFSPTATLQVSRLVPHPAFNRYELTNDIALVLLKTDAPTRPLPVVEALDDDLLGTPLFFVGYGVTNGEAQDGSGKKRGVWIPVTDLDPTRFAYAARGRNTCNGDSGGPALLKEGGHYTVAGVTSWGDATCAQFGVDTRADVFRDFIGE